MQAWGVSDRGMVREENQDSFAMEKLSERSMLVTVCDGMGGVRGGALASGLALETFIKAVKNGWKDSLKAEKTAALLIKAAEKANDAVFQRAAESAEFDGMGTTLVAATVRADSAVIVNVGDSRAYLISDGIRCVTVDHSLVQLMVERGELTKEEAKNHPRKNIITRAIGTEPTVEADTYPVPLKPGDCLLLCSDGLSNVMADQEILFEVLHGGSRESCCERLLELAKKRGAPDNVTAVLAYI
ncbi:MAG: Stp1/IreP family PP2C-type Ser/Thr phosphatase [Oscillospiraceae bacterium]|nr:Stp1/IreP family PP2C-type Ser/Thr phosphatase [Oscillospiraceae bacterium]